MSVESVHYPIADTICVHSGFLFPCIGNRLLAVTPLAIRIPGVHWTWVSVYCRLSSVPLKCGYKVSAVEPRVTLGVLVRMFWLL